MSLPTDINLADTDFRTPDGIINDINEYLADKYGAYPASYGYEIKLTDIDWDCEHEDIEWGDDDERGECKICGATCDWHYEKEVVDNYPDYIKEVEVRVPHEWHEKGE